MGLGRLKSNGCQRSPFFPSTCADPNGCSEWQVWGNTCRRRLEHRQLSAESGPSGPPRLDCRLGPRDNFLRPAFDPPQFAFNRNRLLRAPAQLARPSWGPMLC